MDGEISVRSGSLYEALRAAEDVAGIVGLARRMPEVLEDAFLAQVDAWIQDAAAAGETAAASGLGQRRAVLRELRQARDRETALPPVGRALMEFIRAGDESEAGEVFERERAVLDSADAQRLLETTFRSDDHAGQARIAERAALLRGLRGRA